MKILEQLERLKYIHQLIENEQTGTPDDFAEKLHIGKRHLFRMLDELRLLGLPIEYNATLKTYYYSRTCSFSIDFNLEVLSEQEMLDISGGTMSCPILPSFLTLY